MKKLYITLLTACALIGLGSTTSIEAKTTKLRAAASQSPKHSAVTAGFKPFATHLSELSGKEIQTQFWSGGALLGAKEMLPGLENGIADVGVLALTQFPAEFPYFQLISELNILSNNNLATAATVAEFVILECEPCRNEFTSKGLVFTSTYATTPYTLISKKPITKTDDLRGKTFRSAGTGWDRWISYVNGTAVTVAADEMFEAMDRGGLDVAIFAPSGLKTYSLWDTAKYNTRLNLWPYSAMSLFTFNQNTWRNIDESKRRLILNEAAAGTVNVTLSHNENDDLVDAEASAHGVKIVPASQELIAQRDEFVAETLSKLSEIAESRYGIPDSEQWIQKYKKLLSKWEDIFKKNTADANSAIKILREQIYNKIDIATYGM